MAQKTKKLNITIWNEGGTFSTFFKKFAGSSKDYDFEGLAALRNLLSNEKARMINVIKVKKPSSIYALAKLLDRDFKSVYSDLLVLSRFGFVDFIAEKKGKREMLKPILLVDSLTIEINV